MLARASTHTALRHSAAAVLRGNILASGSVGLFASSSRPSSVWSHVKEGPPDAILGLTVAYNEDTAADKVSLGVGAYRDDQGKPFVLQAIREAERRVVESGANMEYAGIDGVPAFVKVARQLAFGPDHPLVQQNLVVSSQTLSGTGALRVATAWLERFSPSKTIYMPTPTWANHKNIFNDGGLTPKSYRHYAKEVNGFDYEGCLEDIQNAEDGSIFLFHACAHNPTGVDPTLDQWKGMSQACKSKGHIIFFDSAYQGFASGDPTHDALSYQAFIEDGHQVVLCQSFAKNMGLYGHRTGALHITCASAQEYKAVLSQLKILIRPMYSNPPIHGARVVAETLSDPSLHQQWRDELAMMADRIKGMRTTLVNELKAAGSTRDWSHITSQIGMFCYTGITPEQVTKMREEHHVYMTQDGRISVAGLNQSNVTKVAKALHAVTN